MKTREQVQMLSSVVSFCGVSVWGGLVAGKREKRRDPRTSSLCTTFYPGWGSGPLLSRRQSERYVRRRSSPLRAGSSGAGENEPGTRTYLTG